LRRWLIVALPTLVVILGMGLWQLRPAGAGRQAVPADGPDASAHPSASPSASSRPAGVTTAWRLSFDADFSGSRLNTSVWATCYPWMDVASGCTNFGNSDELEWYLPSQDMVSGGVLHLVAELTPTLGQTHEGAPKEYYCRSGMVTTYPNFRFEYGYLQVVARIPLATGLWPALWLAASNQQWPPEIDILEHWGTNTHTAGVYFHPVGAAELAVHPATANLSVGWHTFGLYWTPSKLAWFIDGREVMSADQQLLHQSMYFIANLADYRLPQSGTGCVGTLLIRSVKVWQP
jgi:beta-glucanase (GH16 family)